MHQIEPNHISNFSPNLNLLDYYIVKYYEDCNLSINELEVLRNTASSIAYNSDFLDSSLAVIQYFDNTILARFFKWLEFLNELKNTIYFEGLIKSVILCFKEQKLIHHQTEYQFEQSKRFLKELSTVETSKNSMIAPKTFFLSILISSRRPDLMVNTIKQLLYIQETKNFETTNSWFSLFFGNVNPLQFLGNHLEVISAQEIELLIASLSGESLRKNCQDYFPMSHKEQAILFSGKIKLDNPESQILERYIIAARLLKVEPKTNYLVQQFITKTETFKNELCKFNNDIHFWHSVLKILFSQWRDNKVEIYNNEINNLLDYIIFQRYVPIRKIPFSLKGRTYESMVRSMNEWHDLQDFKASRKDLKQRWKPLSFGNFITNVENIEYRIEELNTGIALLKEGRKMKHCVFSYLNSCVKYSTHIFSLKKRKERGYKHIATIEVQNMSITQAYSKSNGKLNTLQKDILEQWMNAVGLNKRIVF